MSLFLIDYIYKAERLIFEERSVSAHKISHMIVSCRLY